MTKSFNPVGIIYNVFLIKYTNYKKYTNHKKYIKFCILYILNVLYKILYIIYIKCSNRNTLYS